MTIQFPLFLKTRLKTFSGKILVTGATGWLGRATLEMLDDLFKDEITDRVIAIASTNRVLILGSGRKILLHTFSDVLEMSTTEVLLIHYAFLTRDKVKGIFDASYIDDNRKITKLACDVIKYHNTYGIFSVSSGAVYNKDGALTSDMINNPYGCLKIEEENSLLEIAEKKDIKINICRLFNLSGPYIHKEFALNSILNGLLFENKIVLRSRNRVIRDFTHVQDIISLGFALIMKESKSMHKVYDSGIGNPIEIGDLAEKCKLVFQLPRVPILRDSVNGIDDVYIGDINIISNLFLENGISPSSLCDQIYSTGEFLIHDNSVN